MFNPLSWSLDFWYLILQWASFAILGLTVAIGAILSGRQVREIARIEGKAAADVEQIKSDAATAKQEHDEQMAAANERAENLERDNLTMRGQVATLEKQATDAKTAQLQMEKSLEEARAATIDSLKKSNEAMVATYLENRARREIEDALTPRELNPARSREDSEILRKFSGTKFRVVTLPDTEPRRLGVSIAKLLRGAGWEQIGFEETPDPDKSEIFDGVSVTAKDDPSFMEAPIRPTMEAVVEVLQASRIDSQKWHAGHRNGEKIEVPEGEIRIAVGLKPPGVLGTINWDREREKQRLLEWAERNADSQQSDPMNDASQEKSEPPSDSTPKSDPQE
jgi:hypothetical protein